MYTRHAETRCQQRGIRREVVDLLLDCGRRRSKWGAEVLFMDGAARREARRLVGERAYARVADRLDAYLVVSSDGQIVTAARRHGRLKFK